MASNRIVKPDANGARIAAKSNGVPSAPDNQSPHRRHGCIAVAGCANAERVNVID
jgi:hypothetical protein